MPSVERKGNLPDISSFVGPTSNYEVVYVEDEKLCYKKIVREDGSISWVKSYENTSLEGLYEAADAIRLVLNYKDDIYSTAFKNFNNMIKILNEELGYNFPTNTNTV